MGYALLWSDGRYRQDSARGDGRAIGVGWGGLLEGRDPWGMLYYGVMVDKTVRAVMDARSEGEDGWDG